jgi:RNA polymerase sigma factor for flagellar operon FliA
MKRDEEKAMDDVDASNRLEGFGTYDITTESLEATGYDDLEGEDLDSLSEREVVGHYRQLVNGIVRQLWDRCNHTLTVNDMRAYGYLGLWEAWASYRVGQQASFVSYAYLRVRGAILDGVRKCGWGPRRTSAVKRDDTGARDVATESDESIPAGDNGWGRLARDIAAVADQDLSVLLMGPKDVGELEVGVDGGQWEKVAYEDRMGQVRRALDEMSRTEQRVLRLYYFAERPMSAIAEDLECSKGWVSKLHDRALEELKARVRGESEEADEEEAEVVEFCGEGARKAA